MAEDEGGIFEFDPNDRAKVPWWWMASAERMAEHDREVRETVIDWMVEEARLLLKSDYLAAHGHEALDEVRRRAHANFGVPLPGDAGSGS